MERALFAGFGLLALTAGPAAACEWHEMSAYEYGAPQRYSPFARAQQHEPSEQPDPAQRRTDLQGAPEASPRARSGGAEEQSAVREGENQQERQRERVSAERQ